MFLLLTWELSDAGANMGRGTLMRSKLLIVDDSQSVPSAVSWTIAGTNRQYHSGGDNTDTAIQHRTVVVVVDTTREAPPPTATGGEGEVNRATVLLYYTTYRSTRYAYASGSGSGAST